MVGWASPNSPSISQTHRGAVAGWAAMIDSIRSRFGSALRPEAAARYAAVLKALADPHRLRMLSIIAAQPATALLCVCEIEGEFGLSQPTISHHLKVLREAGLVTVTKRGLWHYYAPNPEGLVPVHAALAALAPAADGTATADPAAAG